MLRCYLQSHNTKSTDHSSFITSPTAFFAILFRCSSGNPALMSRTASSFLIMPSNFWTSSSVSSSPSSSLPLLHIACLSPAKSSLSKPNSRLSGSISGGSSSSVLAPPLDFVAGLVLPPSPSSDPSSSSSSPNPSACAQSFDSNASNTRGIPDFSAVLLAPVQCSKPHIGERPKPTSKLISPPPILLPRHVHKLQPPFRAHILPPIQHLHPIPSQIHIPNPHRQPDPIPLPPPQSLPHHPADMPYQLPRLLIRWRCCLNRRHHTTTTTTTTLRRPPGSKLTTVRSRRRSRPRTPPPGDILFRRQGEDDDQTPQHIQHLPRLGGQERVGPFRRVGYEVQPDGYFGLVVRRREG